jgi:hypothetical protein
MFASCYYDVEEILYPDTECDIEMMSYTNDIVPILSDNCYTCHNTQARFGNIILDSHQELSKYFTTNDLLLGAIKHNPGFSAMPQGAPKLLDCQINKIEAWINQGAPNN